MRKRFICAILTISMFLLSSCSFGGGRSALLNISNDDDLAKSRLKKVLVALKNQDRIELKSMFSQQALKEADDIDGNIDSLFDFFQGKVVSWKKDSGPTVFKSNHYGHNKKEINSYYYVTTDKGKYYFLFEDFPVDTDHPDNVGLYLLLVVKAEDRLKVYDHSQKILFDGEQEISRSGIYLPIK